MNGTADIRFTGALSDGRAMKAAGVMTEEIVREVGREAMLQVQKGLGRALKNPTGYYESQIMIDRTAETAVRVHDSGVIYGPWLEGVSSRNQSTRFKGYATFRRAKQRTQKRVPQIAGPIKWKHTIRMNAP